MSLFRLLLIGVLISLFPISAFSKSIEIKSENFVLVGSVREADGKALLLELEQYRQAILQMLGVHGSSPEIVPVRIYTVSGDKELKLLTGRADIGGVYQSTLEGPVFILNSQKGFRRGKQARHIALHEFTHHVLAAYTDQVYPRWYNEGLANYFSTFEVTKEGYIVIGRPYNPYAYTLSQKPWMPTNTLVNSVLSYPFRSTGKSSRGLSTVDFFYAQSWLAVHYIQSVKGETTKLNSYVNLLNEKRGVSNAYEQAFGRTPEEFETLLKAYHRRNKYRTLTIKLKIAIRDHAFQVRQLSKGEAEFHKAEAMRFFSSKFVKTEQVRKQYDKAAKILGETPEVLSARADLATWDNDYEQAQSLVDRALEVDPENPSVLRMAGMVLLYKNRNGDKSSDAELEKARTLFKKALIKNPDDVAAHYYFAATSAMMYERPSAQALASAETALSYYRSNNAIETNLNMAQVLLRGGKYKPALPAVNKAMIWSRNGSARMQARSMKREIERDN